MRTKPSGSAKGSGRSITVLTTLKIAALAPTPRARVIAATNVNPGLFRSDRAAYRTSCSHDIIHPPCPPEPWRRRARVFDDVRTQTVINGGNSWRAGQGGAVSPAQRARGSAKHLRGRIGCRPRQFRGGQGPHPCAHRYLSESGTKHGEPRAGAGRP